MCQQVFTAGEVFDQAGGRSKQHNQYGIGASCLSRGQGGGFPTATRKQLLEAARQRSEAALPLIVIVVVMLDRPEHPAVSVPVVAVLLVPGVAVVMMMLGRP
jgi:hypothetical protein